jgi:methionine aminopeptidase
MVLHFGLAVLSPAEEGSAVDQIPAMRQRVRTMQQWWEEKRERVLPAVMREQNIDVWIIRSDEADKYYNNEGPVFTSLLIADFQGRVIPSVHASDGSQALPKYLVFIRSGNDVSYVEPRDLAEISSLIGKNRPRRVAIGAYGNHALESAVSREGVAVVDSWTLGVRWLETMLPEQIESYRLVQRVANEIIAEAFSNAVIVPGKTTTDDLNWWLRDRALELDLEFENHPSIGVQRKPENIARYNDPPSAFRHGRSGNADIVTIQRGDIVSIDADIFLLGLVTDSHQHAYVLEEGEDDVPADLVDRLRKVNEVQDACAREFRVGRTGREIAEACSKVEMPPGYIEIDPAFHPPPMYLRRFMDGGYMFSHKTWVAGMTSGPGYYPTSIVSNEHRLHLNTLYAFEPHAHVSVSGWGEDGVELGMGQIVAFTKKGIGYLARSQQSQWHVVR